MIKLKDSGVRFLEDSHQYFLGDKELDGITGTLIKRAFPDTYANIPEQVLARAAERGGLVHNTFEIFNTVYDSDIKKWAGDTTQELLAYSDMLISYDLHHVDSEYIVTDGEHFASAIDAVFVNSDGEVFLADYKTTSQLHYNNVSLQLSIYAKWFEQMNPDVKVSHLVCMWFKNGQSKFQPLPRVTDEKIDELIYAYLGNDEEYRYKVEVPEEFSSLEQEYRLLTARIDALTIKQSEIKANMMSLMERNKAKQIKTEYGSYSYVAASKTQRFDMKLFRDTEPEHYEHYLRESETKPQIRIKLL